MGPTGAGKSFLAQRLYELKKQRHQLSGAFVEVNCATLHGDGAASALFGHVRGAYTGAAQDRAGLLRSAHRGLLFLDEIGELGLDEQAMLLKAIEEKRFYPVGSDTEVQSDFQLIAGTNRNLAQDVRAGRFREDLLARIKLWTYTLPGLSERREDLAPNLDYLLEQFSAQQGQRIHMNKEARDIYLRFAASPAALWSGNFRDLSASVTRMATLANQGRIDTPLVQHEIQRLQRDWQALGAEPAALHTDGVLSKLFSEQRLAEMDLFDQTQLETVVSVCLKSASLSEAGRTLFAASRARKAQSNDADRVRKYLMKFGLQFEQIRAAVQ
jgi:transcriptional regulatory protein RtcR